MRSIHYIYSCCLFSLMCTGLVALSAVQSPSNDAIGIASLPDRSDVALATSSVAQSSSIDAIGIASLPDRSEVGATSSVMYPLDTAALDSEWQSLIDQMHAVERVATFFVESRTFAFRKEPKLYRGVFRKEIDGRVSLAYSEPEAVSLHIGDGFAYYRKGEGPVRRIPDSNSQGGALVIFPQLLNFDLAALAQTYDISGAIESESWHLSFVAHADLQGDLPYQSMRVTGHGTAVMRIELTKSQKQGIVIEMGEPVYPEFYLPEIKAQYFFRPDLDQ